VNRGEGKRPEGMAAPNAGGSPDELTSGVVRTFASSYARALVVDDDDQLRRSLARLLRSLHLEVAEAKTVAEAVALLAGDFDLVITDVRLTDGNGVTVAATASRKSMPPLICAMSGLASASEAFALAQAGARVYLTKPFAHEELLVAISDTRDASTRDGGSRPSDEKRSATPRDYDAAMLQRSLERFATRYKVPAREMDLVRLAVAGVPRAHCPALLGVSDNTCKTMTRRLLQRCDARKLSDIPRILLLRDGEPKP
jgi:DNA-binding response OmpR family regulator